MAGGQCQAATARQTSNDVPAFVPSVDTPLVSRLKVKDPGPRPRCHADHGAEIVAITSRAMISCTTFVGWTPSQKR